MGISNICAVDGCENTPLMNLFGQWVCGDCVVIWNKKNEARQRKEFEEVLNGD